MAMGFSGLLRMKMVAKTPTTNPATGAFHHPQE